MSTKSALKTHGVQDASKEDVQAVAQGMQHSLSNHEGNGIERVGERKPGRWKLKEAAN
jgi:hypothetical protein